MPRRRPVRTTAEEDLLAGAPIPDAATLGRLVRQRRKKSGVTLAEAAGLSGVGVRFLHELEHGKPTTSLGKVLQVLQRMGLEVWIGPRGARQPGARE